MTEELAVEPCDQKWDHSPPVQPDAGHWKTPNLPKPQQYHVPPPPENCSPETRAELLELHQLANLQTEASLHQVFHWSTDEASPLVHWAAVLDECARLYRISPPAAARLYAALADAIYRAFIACWQAKWEFLRPRPTDLDPSIPHPIPVPKHPSYPSGHSTCAGAAAAVLSNFFPDEAKRWHAIAEEAGLARLKAGIHYRSDHTAGLALGQAVAEGVLKAMAKDGGPKEYHL